MELFLVYQDCCDSRNENKSEIPKYLEGSSFQKVLKKRRRKKLNASKFANTVNSQLKATPPIKAPSVFPDPVWVHHFHVCCPYLS